MSGATQYGFDWGPMVVERVAHIEGRGYCVSIRGRRDYKGPEIQVLVSEKGRSVTAYPLRNARVKQAATNDGEDAKATEGTVT
jgi:hypothetical protein